MSRKFEWLFLMLTAGILGMGVIPRLLFFNTAPGALEDYLGDVLARQFVSFMTLLGYAFSYFIAASSGIKIAGIIIGILVLRAVYLTRESRPQPPPEFGLFICFAMVFLQFFFDVSAPLMFGLLAAFLVPHGGALFNRVSLSPLVIAATGPLWLDAAESSALFVFAVLAALVGNLTRSGRVSTPAGTSLLLAAIPCMQLFSAWLPGTIVYSPREQFSKLLALSFCESESRDLVFVVHPQCPMAMFAEKCRDGFIGVYERKSLAPHSQIRLFSADYYGRPEQISCDKDRLFISLNSVRSRGMFIGPNAMIGEMTSAGFKIRENFVGQKVGNSFLHDSIHDALFMTSEWDKRIYRWDLRERTMETAIGDALPNPWDWPEKGGIFSGSRISHHEAISIRRNAGYFSEWINGRYVHELDLTTFKPLRQFRFNGGASVGATVDEENDQIWISHLWGVSVFNLSTGALVAKHRTGFVNRPAAIDKLNDLVFLPSTVRGRVLVFERNTGRPIRTLPLGLGSRYLHVSLDTKRLYASSWSGSYAFDITPGSPFIAAIRNSGGRP